MQNELPPQAPTEPRPPAGDQTFQCFRVHADSAGVETRKISDLPPGDVLIRAAYSSVNYKDALAGTGAGKIIRDFPLIAGIDVAGTVAHSTDPRFQTGEAVVVTGCGLGERHDGGFSQYVRVPGNWVVTLPENLSPQDAMKFGTAGFTAALAIDRMERNRQTPDDGTICVTGATGGVGSFAIRLLTVRGYDATAITGKRDAEDYLRQLGATHVLFRDELELGTRPLEKAQFAGAIDNIGGEFLGWLTRVTATGGNVTAIGLAGGSELNMTVMPFILRGVNLLGINSVNVAQAERQTIWNRLAAELQSIGLDKMIVKRVTLDALPQVFDSMLQGNITGRTIVEL